VLKSTLIAIIFNWVNNANDKSISFSWGHTSCALKGEQSDVDDAEGTVTFKEFRFGRNFG
jgi:hypothetical protein